MLSCCQVSATNIHSWNTLQARSPLQLVSLNLMQRRDLCDVFLCRCRSPPHLLEIHHCWGRLATTTTFQEVSFWTTGRPCRTQAMMWCWVTCIARTASAARPNIALSELAMTIKDMSFISQFSGTAFTHKSVEDLLASLQKLLPTIVRMNNEDKTDQTLPSREEVVGLLKEPGSECWPPGVCHGQLQRSGAAHDADNPGPSHTDTQPEHCVKKVSSEPQHEDPTPRRMQNYILDTVTKKCHNIPRTISV